ncbi:MAG TPA: CAP domain-containing protein [Ideonella sp.]|jgi:uncharacterized protein YkwD|nr:CAP domain-containing protein [Ideonella sp.]
MSPIRRRLRLACWLSLTSLAGAAPVAVRAADAWADVPRVEREVIERSNAFRQAQGLAPVATNATLGSAAKAFAAFMVRTGDYGHEADGHSPAERAQAQGYAYCMVAENLAYVQGTMRFSAEELAQRFVQGWIDSPGHRHNLLSAEAIDIAVAVAHDSRQRRYYAVQMFGRPAALRTRFEISNRSEQTVRYQLGDTRYTLPPRVTREHEQCITPTLSLELPGRPGTTTLQPGNGGSYRIEPAGRGLRLVSR